MCGIYRYIQIPTGGRGDASAAGQQMNEHQATDSEDAVREYLPKGFNGSRNITHRVIRNMEGVDPHTARLVIRHQVEGGCRDTTNIPP